VAFDTTPHLSLNLQQKFDLWVEENEKPLPVVQPLYHTSVRRIHRKKRGVNTH
jgi:plasmid maintenance system antidote protein VapI